MNPRLLLGIVCSVAFAALVFRGVNATELVHHILGVNPIILLPALAAYALGVWLRALRWQVLLRAVALVPVRRLFTVELIGYGVNNVMPLRVGELLRAWLLARSHGVKPAASIGTIVVERVLDGLFLCLVLTLGLARLELEEWLRQGAIVAALAFGLAGVGILAVSLLPGVALLILGRAVDLAPERLRVPLLGHGQALLGTFASLGRGWTLPLAMGLTALGWLGEGGVYWLTLIALGLPGGAEAGLLGMAAANLATIIPSSPGYVGVFHLPLQSILVTGYHVDASEAAAYAIVTHALIVLPVAVLGVLLLMREGLTLATVRERAASWRKEMRGSAGGGTQT